METTDAALTIDLPAALDVVKALAHEPRAALLAQLKQGALNVNELSERLQMPQSTVATNIGILERVGLVAAQYVTGRKGVQKQCSLACNAVVVRF